jgi:LysR family transcriptional activator of nhaA
LKWLNYHHLIYFREIAHQGTISKASENLKVGQPALSTQLKNLEEYLGVELFERKNKKLTLTEAGKVALDYASKISDLGQELVQVIDQRAFSEERVQLSVGALDGIPKHLICDIVDFAHKKTGCFLSIIEDTIDPLLSKLVSHQIEVILSDHKINVGPTDKIFSRQILKRPIVAYASPDYNYLTKKFPHSLDHVPCIVPTKDSQVRLEIEDFFTHKNIHPTFIAETQDTSLQKILAAKGDGVIFLPEFTTKELVQHKKLVRIGELENVFAEYFLIYAKRVFDNPALNHVIKQNFEQMQLG